MGEGYPVRVGCGVVDQLVALLHEWSPAHQYALIADARVFDLHGSRVQELCTALTGPMSVHTFAPGEERKNREEWARLTDELLAAGLGRDGCVISLGGGVTGDLAGFVAASYMRGIPIVHVPTSLVAMVDASIGGKTGVDVSMGKNLVGAFHPPRFVLSDPELCTTLPRGERAQGLAEALKHGAVMDEEYFEWIEANAERLLEGDVDVTAALVARSVRLKTEVVSEDERESGRRQILNFGHTLGHAIEAESNFLVPHGNAVALGMVLEALLGERIGVTRPGVAGRLTKALNRLELPTDLSSLPDPEVLLRLASRDKKSRRGSVRYVLLSDIGRADHEEGWSREVDVDTIRVLLAETPSRKR